jgi:FtsH-binding integral membrane protein
MTEPTTHPRPRQVTFAAWTIIGGSALVVASVFERVAGLNGLETQEAIETFLASPPGAGLDLDVEGVLTIIRALSMVAAGCAAAATILGLHLLRGSRGARLGITVLAVPLFLSGLVAGGFLSSLVAASAVLLWLEPSRDWFDGKPARQQPEPERRVSERPVPPPVGPRPQEGFGTVPPGPPPFTGSPYAAPAPPQAPPTRPDSVLWACILTWVFSGAAGLAMATLALVVAASPEMFFDELRRQDPELARNGLTDQALTTAIYVTAAVTVVWSAVATTLAVLLFRRVPWARLALAACAAGAGVVCLLAATGSVVMLAPLAGCVVTFSLLLRRDIRAWVAAP